MAARADAAAPRIEIAEHAFSPPAVTAPVGATVTWVNRDEDVRTVVSTTAAFRSAALETGDAYSFTFTKPGVCQYVCTLHPLMTGSVIVERVDPDPESGPRASGRGAATRRAGGG